MQEEHGEGNRYERRAEGRQRTQAGVAHHEAPQRGPRAGAEVDGGGVQRQRDGSRQEIALESVLYALSDPVRLSITRSLADGRESPCGDLGAGLPKSTLSHHLRVLREAGVTRTRVESTWVYVSLRRSDLDALFPGLLDSIMKASGPQPARRRTRAQR